MDSNNLFLPAKLIEFLPGLPDKELSPECILGSFLSMLDTKTYDFKTIDQEKFNKIYNKLKKLPNTSHVIFTDTFNKYLSNAFEKYFIKYNHPKDQPKTLSDFLSAYKEINITELDLTRYFDSILDSVEPNKLDLDKETGTERLNYTVTKYDDKDDVEYSMNLALMSSEDSIKRTNAFLKNIANSGYVNIYFVSNICGYILRLSGIMAKEDYARIMNDDLAELNGKGSAALISGAIVSNFVINNFRELGKSFF